MLRIRINQMQAECRVAKFKEADPDLFRARMADLMEETLESAQQVATVWWKLGLADEVAGVRKDLEELGKATGRVLDAPDVHRQGVRACDEISVTSHLFRLGRIV